MSRRGRVVAAFGALATVLVVVAIVVATELPGSSKGAGKAVKGGGSSSVQRRDLVATDTESGTLSYANPRTVFNRVSGTITSLPQVGKVIKQGQTLYRVDGSPVVLFNGTVPAYRSLSDGVTDGADVLELNQDLVALGFDPEHQITINNTFDAATTSAVELWQASVGESETGIVTLGQIVFLPGSQRITAVDAALGSTGASGSSSGSGSSATGASYAAPAAPRPEFVSLTTTSTAAARTPTTTPTTTTTTTPTTTTTSPSRPTKGPGGGTKGTGGGTKGAGTRKKKGGKTPSTLAALLALLRAETLELRQSRSSSSGAGGTTGSTGSTGARTGSGSSRGGGGGSSASRASSSGSASGAGSSATGGGSGGSGGSGTGSSSSSGAAATAEQILETTSTQLIVSVDLDATKQTEAVVGEPVTVELPDGSRVDGKITQVSPVAQTSSSSSSSASGAAGSSTPSATIPVTITLKGHRHVTGLDQAAVSVNFEQQVERGVLSVPVTALLATAGGGYAVQQSAPPHRLIPVTPGLFAAGYVQISGSQIYPGLQVTDSQG